MELVWATADFTLAGRSYEGFPILLDAELRSVEPANKFLRHCLIHRGRSFSRKSWPTVAGHLLDYFAYLERTGLSWSEFHGQEGESPVVAYRFDAVEVRGLHPRTVNQRLSTVLRFYAYARERQWLSDLPFTYVASRVHATSDPRRPHLGRTRYSPDVMLRVQSPLVEYLTRPQINQLLGAITNPTHRLMVRVGLQTGLRREEITTLPAAYVETAIAQADHGGMVKIRLDPRDGSGQRTKGSRERTVFFPSSLVTDLWSYLLHERPSLARRSAIKPLALFLTRKGVPWSGDGKAFHGMLSKIGRRLGFAVYPHLLRHTYATYTLAALQAKRDGIDPLVFVQRQLGHASIETTLCYAHVADELVINAVTAFDEEITQWSR